jgi:AcrR family transcriptional regulator
VAKIKTRERILATGLALFNAFGEPNITTNHIADEMDISPGNLYYHFRNKDEIIYCLFERFESQIDACLEVPESRALNMEDMWLYLHLVFESIADFRFLYRDLDNLLSRNRRLRSHFRHIVLKKIATARAICRGLRDTGVLSATDAEIDALSKNIALTTTYSLNFETILSRTPEGVDFMKGIGQAAYQVMALVAPFLTGDARTLLNSLAQEYVSA